MKLIVEIPDDEYEVLMDLKNGVTRPIMHIQNGTPIEDCGDCVSRQAVLELAKFDNRKDLGSIIHALDVEQLPPVTPKIEELEDCVSRKDAIEAVNNLLTDYIPILHGKLVEIPLKCAKVLYALPPVQPKQIDVTDNNVGKMFEGMTNGEVIKAIFSAKVIEENGWIGIKGDSYFTIWFDEEWWNAPYKGGEQNEQS